jgi:anti-sigma B factor antagonist
VAQEDDPIVSQLEVDQHSPDGRTHVLAFRGELDVGTIERFNAALRPALDGGEAPVVIADLTNLTFMDSSGLAALLGVLRRLTQAGGRLVVACANPTVLRLFQITRTDATFEICPTLEHALERARR